MRRLRPIRPSHRAELWYRAELGAIVKVLRRVGSRIGEGLRSSWPRAVSRGNDGQLTAADETDPILPSLLEEEAARFGGLEVQARRLATLAARKNLGEVDERLGKAIHESVGIDLRAVIHADTRIASEVDAAIEANVALIKSIPVEYFERLREAIDKSWTDGARWESLAKTIQQVGDVTESRAKLIARDQTGKLNSDFNRVRQRSLGIDRYIWSTVQDERVRRSHAALNGTTHRWDQPPEVDGEPAHPGQPINCLPGESQIEFAHDVKKAYRRWFSGELAEIVTESGKTLRATPNHPVLTSRGWMPIGALNEGDDVIEVAKQIVKSAEKDHQDRPPLIAEVFEAAAGGGARYTRDLRVDDFHGDGTDGEVEVVLPARSLLIDVLSPGRAKRGNQLSLANTPDSLSGVGPLSLMLLRVVSAADRLVRRSGQTLAFFLRQALHPQAIGFGLAALVNAGLGEPSVEHDPFDAEALGQRQHALARQVGGYEGGHVDLVTVPGRSASPEVGPHTSFAQAAREGVIPDADDSGRLPQCLPFAQKASRVVKALRINGWSGHVFNLETSVGWYVTGGIVTHNCRCVPIPVFNLDELDAGVEQEQVAA